MPIGVISTTMKLHSQFVAVPRAAPLFFIDRLLISAGYSHGTPGYSQHRSISAATLLELTLESNTKEDIVEEEESNTSFGHFGLMSIALQLVVSNHHRDDQVAEALPCGSVHEHLPPAPSLNVRDTNGREEEIANAVDGGQQASHLFAETNGFNKYLVASQHCSIFTNNPNPNPNDPNLPSEDNTR